MGRGEAGAMRSFRFAGMEPGDRILLCPSGHTPRQDPPREAGLQALKGRAATFAVAGPPASVSSVPGSSESRCT